MFSASLRAVALGSAALVSSCIVTEDARPDLVVGVDVASAYVHRGMVQNEEGVIQPTVDVSLPAKQEGRIILRTFANMDLSNDTGDAWLPNGHAGKFSQIDYNLLYEQKLGDSVLVTGGFINYNLPNGTEFPFGERGATSEFMLSGLYQLPKKWLSLRPSMTIHYDFDEVDGFYIEGGLNHSYELTEETSVHTSLGLGWMDGDQTFWNYGIPDDVGGLADARARVTVDHEIRPGTVLTGFAAYSRVMDSELQDWFDLIQIDSNQTYAGLGVRWIF